MRTLAFDKPSKGTNEVRVETRLGGNVEFSTGGGAVPFNARRSFDLSKIASRVNKNNRDGFYHLCCIYILF
ncbi:MAG: hypothetical protein K6E29_02955 [Cyanobacteria bacterium RUI128]|nr:hypothetical protein [Cyanobacteria bacterium RUI128]